MVIKMTTLLKTEKLSKTYPGFRLDNVDLTANSGEIVGFIGRNGAGKSTTLKSLLGFVRPDSGTTEFFGMPFAGNENAVKQSIGFVPGGVDYYPKSKIKTLIGVTKRFYSGWDDKVCDELLAKFNISKDKTPSELSAGMKVKLSLTLALSHSAKLLILDEPTSGLDPVSRDELLDILLDLRKEGIGILFSTHIITDLERAADRIVYIRGGKIAADRTVNEFESDYRILSYRERPLGVELIGEREERDGFTALVRSETGLGEKAGLEEIMLHLERS